MKRRWWIVAGFTAAGAIAMAVAVAGFREDRVNYEAFHEIEIGMEEAEVIRILGQPDEVAYCEGMKNERFFLLDGWWRKTWRGGSMNISVSIGGAGQVTDAWTEHPDTLVVKFLRWIGLREAPPPSPYRIHGGVGPASSSI